MRTLPIVASLLLAGCGPKESVLASDWTNGRQPCSENHLSFRNGKIAYYPKGKDVLVLAEIVWMQPVPSDPELTIVQTRPSLLVLQSVEKHGIKLSGDVHPTLVFRVHDRRLSLVTQARNENEKIQPAFVRQKKVFDLIACPS